MPAGEHEAPMSEDASDLEMLECAGSTPSTDETRRSSVGSWLTTLTGSIRLEAVYQGVLLA